MTPVVAVAVPDQPGGLARVLSVLSRAQIDIEYMYSVFGQVQGQAYMIFRVKDEDLLRGVLAAEGIAAVGGDELGIH